MAWTFASLCLLVSNRWLIEEAAPSTSSTALTQAAGCLMAAGVATVPVLFRRSQTPPRTLPWVELLKRGACAALAICGPALGASISDRHVSGDNATLALCLTPVVLAVALSATEVADEDGGLAARLWPGLAGLAALLLLIPQPLLEGWRFLLALALMPLLTGIGAAMAGRSPNVPQGPTTEKRSTAAPWKTIAFLVAAAMFACLGFVSSRTQRSPFKISAAALDGLTALLSIMVLERLRAIGWAAQFLAIPLLTLVEGAVLLRPVLDLRSWLAIGLLAVSSAYLLFTQWRGAARRWPVALV